MSNKVCIDTSVFIRFLTQDDAEKYPDCLDFFQRIEQGKLRPYISQVVILEIIFVLSRLHSFSKKQVLAAIDQIYNIRNITVIETTDTRKALELYGLYTIKYQDCLIVTQIPQNCTLVTYDAEFKAIPKITALTPKEIIALD